jgi:hypothetical protein
MFSWAARYLNESLNKTLKLEAAKVAAKPPVRLWEVRTEDHMGTWPPRNKHCRNG